MNIVHPHTDNEDRCCLLQEDLTDIERRAATLGRNRALVEGYRIEELREELAFKFRNREAISAGIDAFRKAREMLARAA